MRSRWFAPVVALILLALGLLALPHLPGQVPSHWNARGELNGTQPKLLFVFMGPAIVLAIWLLALVLPRIDPRGRGYAGFLSTYWLIMNAVAVFTALTFAFSFARAFGIALASERVIPAGVGPLLALIGNELGRVQPNWFVGIRTPWTLSDREIWRATHRLGAKTMVAGGLAVLVFGLFAPVGALEIGMLALIGAAVMAPVRYSYLLWQGGPHGPPVRTAEPPAAEEDLQHPYSSSFDKLRTSGSLPAHGEPVEL